MATLKAKKLQEALNRAKKVGLVEESVTITGCDIVLTNLQPEQFEDIIQEVAELEDVEYFHAYQMGHVCRSIIEIDGVDLRDVGFIEVEVEEEDPANPGQTKTKVVKVERHEWVKSDILATWGREALTVAWRKFCDVLKKAENAAQEGVSFDLSMESPEEKYRRLLDEAKEVEGGIPPELITTILGEKGYLTKASQTELDAVGARVDRLAQEQEEAESQKPPEAPQEHPQPEPEPIPQAAPETPPEAPQAASPDVQQMMAQRQPLNQTAVQPPIPKQRQVVDAQERVPVPEHIKAAAGLTSPLTKAQLAAQEQESLAALDPKLAVVDVDTPHGTPPPQEVAELRKQGTLDGAAIAAITEQPPPVGINPRYRKPLV